MKKSLLVLVLSTIVLVVLVSAVVDARPMLGWEVKRDIVAGTNKLPSNITITAAKACALLKDASVPAGWKKIVLDPIEGNDTIYLWYEADYPLVFSDGKTKLADGSFDTAQRYERGGMIPLADEHGKLGGYQVVSADEGVITLDLHGIPMTF